MLDVYFSSAEFDLQNIFECQAGLLRDFDVSLFKEDHLSFEVLMPSPIPGNAPTI